MNQVPVKWVHQERLVDERASVDVSTLPNYVPVIELSALTEVVERLSDQFWAYEQRILCEDQRAGLTREQRIGAMIALDWVKLHMLAQLEGHTKGGGDE